MGRTTARLAIAVAAIAAPTVSSQGYYASNWGYAAYAYVFFYLSCVLFSLGIFGGSSLLRTSLVPSIIHDGLRQQCRPGAPRRYGDWGTIGGGSYHLNEAPFASVGGGHSNMVYACELARLRAMPV
jgi:hypothetical protein